MIKGLDMIDMNGKIEMKMPKQFPCNQLENK